MARCYAWIISALSLILGLAASAQVDRFVRSISAVIGVSPIVLWIVAYVMLFAIVLLISLLVGFVLEKLAARRLQKVLRTADRVKSQLGRVNREFSLETRFDSKAEDRLTQAVETADKVITTVVRCPPLARTRKSAPDVWAILLSICRHTNVEVARPFMASGYVSKQDTQDKVSQSSWGIACVNLLLHQLQEAVAGRC